MRNSCVSAEPKPAGFLGFFFCFVFFFWKKCGDSLYDSIMLYFCGGGQEARLIGWYSHAELMAIKYSVGYSNGGMGSMVVRIPGFNMGYR